MDEKKQKALESVLAQIEKQYGKGAIMKMDASGDTSVEVIPTGCLSLDLALGIGGMPRGRIVEIYGPESSGKTTVALQVIASAQKHGGVAAFVDAENALDPVYAKNLGVDIENLYVSQPDDGEQALAIVDTLVKSGAVDVVVVDSVAALTPRAELEGEIGDSHVGQLPRLMSQALRMLAGVVNKNKTCVIFINQLREKIGVMFGNPETTPGGKALKYFTSVRIDVRKGDTIKSGDGILGTHTKAKIVKNKLAPPFKTAEFDIIYGKGVSNESCLIELGVEYGVLEKSGAWISYNGERIGQGKDKAKDYLAENAEVAKEIENAILAKYAELKRK